MNNKIKKVIKKDINYNKINNIQKLKSNPNISIESVKLTPNVNVDICKEILIPKDIDGYKQYIMPNYTPYKHKIDIDGWDKTSEQYQLTQKWLQTGAKSDRGIAVIDGRYLVAMTSYYGNVNDNVDIVLDDGTIIPCKIADIKNVNDSDYHKYGHISSPDNVSPAIDIVEWELSGDIRELNIEDWHYKKVDKVLVDRYKG